MPLVVDCNVMLFGIMVFRRLMLLGCLMLGCLTRRRRSVGRFGTGIGGRRSRAVRGNVSSANFGVAAGAILAFVAFFLCKDYQTEQSG